MIWAFRDLRAARGVGIRGPTGHPTRYGRSRRISPIAAAGTTIRRLSLIDGISPRWTRSYAKPLEIPRSWPTRSTEIANG